MEKNMPMPQFYGLVRLVAQIGAALGCLGGVIVALGALAAFRYSAWAAFSGIFSGVIMVLGSLAVLGVTYCFLSIVKATVDTRNATVERLDQSGDAG